MPTLLPAPCGANTNIEPSAEAKRRKCLPILPVISPSPASTLDAPSCRLDAHAAEPNVVERARCQARRRRQAWQSRCHVAWRTRPASQTMRRPSLRARNESMMEVGADARWRQARQLAVWAVRCRLHCCAGRGDASAPLPTSPLNRALASNAVAHGSILDTIATVGADIAKSS